MDVGVARETACVGRMVPAKRKADEMAVKEEAGEDGEVGSGRVVLSPWTLLGGFKLTAPPPWRL